MRRTAPLLPVLLLVAAACSSTPPTSPQPSSTPAPSPTPAVSTPPSGEPASPPASPAPTPAVSPEPAATPVAMTPEEAALRNALRTDVAVRCTPRRTDLPDGALYGIECRPGDSIVARVGIYRYISQNEAAFAYMTRMADAGVDVNAGDCTRDVPADTPWTPGDGEGSIDDPGVFNWENSVLSPDRYGCFRDGNGTANARLVCGDTYIGVLGTGTDLSDLVDWAWVYPEGYEVSTPDLPGICVGAEAYPAGGTPAP